MLEKLRLLGVAHGKMILNAVDTTAFSCCAKAPGLMQKHGLSADQTIVLHVSNLKSVKRFRDLINSTDRALQENDRLVYVIVGDGPPRARHESACAAQGLTDRVKFIGWVSYDAILDYIRLADIVIMPSESEGLARVYLETQACGRLLLASDISAAREISNQGANAMLFRKGVIDDLTTKTLLAASDPNLRVTIGHRAREYVVRHHSLEDAVVSYEAMLQYLVRSESP